MNRSTDVAIALGANLGDPVATLTAVRPLLAAALRLLLRLQELEARFGRQRLVSWPPRTLDLDLLWCGDQRCRTTTLELPHPRLLQRSFVLAPLAAIDPGLVPPGQPHGAGLSCQQLLTGLLATADVDLPERLPARAGWPEGTDRPA